MSDSKQPEEYGKEIDALLQELHSVRADESDAKSEANRLCNNACNIQTKIERLQTEMNERITKALETR